MLMSAAKQGKLTFYWVSDEKRDSGNGPLNTQLYTVKGKPIKKVTRKFAEKIRMEGTGRLSDGRLLNVWDRSKCNYNTNDFACFKDISSSSEWGVGNKGNNLVPYVSVASNTIPHGKTVEIKQFIGMPLPGTNNLKHNGCFRVDDECGSCTTKQHVFDFFAAREQYYPPIEEKLAKHRVDGGSKVLLDYDVKPCQILNYPIPKPNLLMAVEEPHYMLGAKELEGGFMN
jgi:hypothetical protein